MPDDTDGEHNPIGAASSHTAPRRRQEPKSRQHEPARQADTHTHSHGERHRQVAGADYIQTFSLAADATAAFILYPSTQTSTVRLGGDYRCEALSMASFVVHGVDRESGLDTTLRIDASSSANARVKAELKGVVVTEVVDLGANDAEVLEPNHARPIIRAAPRSLAAPIPAPPILPGHSVYAPTVNVNLPRSNSEAVAGMVMGVIACLGGCLPLFNILAVIVGSLGFLFSLSGYFSSFRVGGRGYALARMLLSLLGIAPTAVVLLAGLAASKSADELVMARPSEPAPRTRLPGRATLRDGVPVGFGRAIAFGRALVSVAGAELDSPDGPIVIHVQVRNMSANLALPFKGWNVGTPEATTTLADDFGNTYLLWPRERSAREGSFLKKGSIPASMTADVYISYRAPKPDVMWLELTLPGAPLGEKESTTFRLDATYIKRAH